MATPPATTATRPSADYTLWLTDFDGTVRHGHDELGRFVNGPEDVVVFDEVPDLLAGHWGSGHYAVGITNQGGVALGHMTHDVCAEAVRATVNACRFKRNHGRVDPFYTILVCEHAPRAGCWCRKPAPGMLVTAMTRLAVEMGWPGMQRDALMIGDRPEDREAAERAGVAFRLASEWRGGL